MKIAIIADAKENAGGGYHVAESAATFFNKLKLNNFEFDIICTYKNTFDNLKKIVDEKNLVLFNKENIFNKVNLFIFKINFIKFIFDKFSILNCFEKFLINKKYDLVYFVTPSSMAIYCKNINFIYSIWEFAYKKFPFFPEYKKNYVELREMLHKFVCDNAFKIIFFGNREVEDFKKFYYLDKNRFEKFAYAPAISLIKNFTDEKSYVDNFISNNEYLFYPAQFWPHKNHIYIVESLNLFNKKNSKKIKVVFTGGNMGNLKVIKKRIRELNLENYIEIFSYLKNEEVVKLYKNCLGVLFPSFVGAESYPLFESFFFKKPILYNQEIVDEIYNDSILKLNINDFSSFEKNVNILRNNKEQIETSTNNGSLIYKEMFDEEKIKFKLSRIFNEYFDYKKMWS